MAKYSLETKLAAVYSYLDGVESFRATRQGDRFHVLGLTQSCIFKSMDISLFLIMSIIIS
jgi:hypothetical protein